MPKRSKYTTKFISYRREEKGEFRIYGVTIQEYTLNVTSLIVPDFMPHLDSWIQARRTAVQVVNYSFGFQNHGLPEGFDD